MKRRGSRPPDCWRRLRRGCTRQPTSPSRRSRRIAVTAGVGSACIGASLARYAAIERGAANAELSSFFLGVRRFRWLSSLTLALSRRREREVCRDLGVHRCGGRIYPGAIRFASNARTATAQRDNAAPGRTAPHRTAPHRIALRGAAPQDDVARGRICFVALPQAASPASTESAPNRPRPATRRRRRHRPRPVRAAAVECASCDCGIRRYRCRSPPGRCRR